MKNQKKFLFLSLSILLMGSMLVGCEKSQIAAEPEALPVQPNVQVVHTDPSEKLVSAESAAISAAEPSDKQTQIVNQQSVSVWDFQIDPDSKQASVVVSFDLPTLADWVLEFWGGVRLEIGSETFLLDSGGPLETYYRSQKDGKLFKTSFDNQSAAGVTEEVTDPEEIPVRIDRVSFTLPDALLEKGIQGQTVTLIIDSLILRPYEGQECDADYLAKAQARLDEVQKGIVLACASGDFSQEIVVQQSPKGVDADAVIAAVFPGGIFNDLNKITGPWEFILQP